MQRWPSHQAEDIGARFALPSSFSVLIRTTGVPKYRIARFVIPLSGHSTFRPK